MQEQAEADRDGVRVPKEVVWVSDRAEPEAAKGSGGTEGYEGGSPHCPFPSHFPAPPCFHPHHVSPLWACHHHHHRHLCPRQSSRHRRHFVS